MGQEPKRELRRLYKWSLGPLLLVAGVLVWFRLVPAIERYGRPDRQAQTNAMSNLKGIATALQQYAEDNNGRLPARFSTNADLRAALKGRIKDERQFETLNPAGGEFVPNPRLAGFVLKDVADPSITLLLSETRPWWNSQWMVAFADAHVKVIRDKKDLNTDPESADR